MGYVGKGADAIYKRSITRGSNSLLKRAARVLEDYVNNPQLKISWVLELTHLNAEGWKQTKGIFSPREWEEDFAAWGV